MRIAAAHPGKMGDALYVLPFLRYVYGVTGSKIDFYTSDYCAPLRDLFLYQPYINDFIMPDNYKVERMDLGCQPWQMPIPDRYDQVFQLGFRRVPDRAIHQFIAHEQGVDLGLGIRYECELKDKHTVPGIVIAPRGLTSYNDMFSELAEKLVHRKEFVAIVGGQGDNKLVCDQKNITDLTGYDILTTAYVISKSKAFIGLMSSQLVLANGFDIPRVAPHDGKSWDMRHVVYTPWNHYPINPSADDILNIIKDYI
jgi:ADP-heptose:LPS heptosyltransferase